MKLDIQTSNLEPRRQTYSHIARRFGADRPASRYEEATLDVQATHNFHYRPLWAPEFEIYDPRRTAIQMQDWYAFRDPRQYYYGTYNISRAAMEQASAKALDFVEKRDLLSSLDPAWRTKVELYLLPLRHFEWGANMNNWFIADYGYGTAITAPAAFNAMDRLGMAQIITKIGLIFDGQTGDSLEPAKQAWMEHDAWQGIRHAVEDSFVIEDWFETFTAQNVAFDGVLHPLVFEEFEVAGRAHGAGGVAMMCEFMTDWFTDQARWVDAVVGTAVKESGENAATLGAWYGKWKQRALDAAKPLANAVLGSGADAALERVSSKLEARMSKQGVRS